MSRATAPFHAAAGGRDSRKQDVIADPFSDTALESWGRKLMRQALGNGATKFEFFVACNAHPRQGALRFLSGDGPLFATYGPPVPHLTNLKELRPRLVSILPGETIPSR